MLVVARAGPAVCWSLAQGVAPSQAHADEAPDAVQCGEPFIIEIEARDEHGNRWAPIVGSCLTFHALGTRCAHSTSCSSELSQRHLLTLLQS